MGGGVLQLAAYGGQDIETMGNPQMTFFKSVYKKHTNFSIEIIEQSFNGNITKEESRVDSTISKSGDLIHGCHLDIKFPEFPVGSGSSYNNWVNSTGYAYVKEVSLSIGELQIDKHYSDWMHIWSELNMSNSEKTILDEMIGNIPEIYDPSNGKGQNGLYPHITTSTNNTLQAEQE